MPRAPGGAAGAAGGYPETGAGQAPRNGVFWAVPLYPSLRRSCAVAATGLPIAWVKPRVGSAGQAPRYMVLRAVPLYPSLKRSCTVAAMGLSVAWVKPRVGSAGLAPRHLCDQRGRMRFIVAGWRPCGQAR